ncbi:chalcone-flavanone isomerase-domain-containing protein [Staphylotrichum tortipilum]|uniref:Chalcone-flavanone isomerase-domain-containing protein n=1 Tax=Staphylotrichum tortipilum TaxID=2831512 RepID=A0AAN6MR20_9PEZI|nr:chalcone-flavanone isomerase-domain-containing protein [Staphylotrichum longicolle]
MLRQAALRRLARPPAAASPSLFLARPLACPYVHKHVPVYVPLRTFFSRRQKGRRSGRAVETFNIQRVREESEAYHRDRRLFLWCGLIACMISLAYTLYLLKELLDKESTKLDTGLPSSDPLVAPSAADRKVVVHDKDGREMVPTGNTTVPTFPRTLDLPALAGPTTTAEIPTTRIITSPEGASTEYTLVGLGLRTVTFLNFEVYVVGYYVATADIAALQNALTKKVNPIATTLVPSERAELRSALLDPAEGENTWNDLLVAGIPARSAFRVVPVRDTDFPHLRDGFVRAIQARAVPSAAADDAFGEAMRQFRAFFNRGRVPKRREMLLVRDEAGRLTISYDTGGEKKKEGAREVIGVIEDERVSRALWMNYLAGKKVASEPARKSIVEGIMEFVERPVGTVAAQVVPVVSASV